MSVTLFLLAAIARAIGAIPNNRSVRGAPVLTRCALQAAAAWLLVLGNHAAVPIWPLVPAAVIAAIVRSRFPGRWVALASDAALVLGMAAVSQPGLGAAALAANAAVLAISGFAFDRFAESLPTRGLSLLTSAVVLATAVSVPFVAWQYRAGIWGQFEPVPYVAVSLPYAGTRITLPTGSVAWRLDPRGPRRDTAVLFLHGAHPAGARQSTAIAFRAALSSAGYPVLSLDTMGYGASPTPRNPEAVEQWDERPHLTAAMRYLHQEMGVTRVVAIGHSMGVHGAMRSLGVTPAPARAILFGSAMVQELGRDEYWLQRFHQDRHLALGSVSMAAWKSIHGTNFNGRQVAGSLSTDHAPIVLVHFERDHDDVTRTRTEYARVLPGRFHEFVLTGSNHYLNTTTVGRMPVLGRIPGLRDIVLVDSRLVSDLGRRLPDWIDGGLPRPGH